MTYKGIIIDKECLPNDSFNFLNEHIAELRHAAEQRKDKILINFTSFVDAIPDLEEILLDSELRCVGFKVG